MVGRKEGRCAIIDLHIIHALSNGIKAYRNNEDAFKGLFPEVGEPLKDKYWNKFSTSQLSLEKGFSRKRAKTPSMAVSFNEASSMEEQVLSNGGRNKVLFLALEAKIKVADKDYDLVRILHRLVQSILLLFKDSFLDNGYLNFDFVSSEALENDEMEEFTSKDVIFYSQELTYNAQRILEVQPFNNPVEVFWQLNVNVPFDFDDPNSLEENVLVVEAQDEE